MILAVFSINGLNCSLPVGVFSSIDIAKGEVAKFFEEGLDNIPEKTGTTKELEIEDGDNSNEQFIYMVYMPTEDGDSIPIDNGVVEYIDCELNKIIKE